MDIGLRSGTKASAVRDLQDTDTGNVYVSDGALLQSTGMAKTRVTSAATPVPILIPQCQHMCCKSRPTISCIHEI